MDKYIGKILDNRYEIIEIIGTGGMAVVYKARCRLLNRYVAIKILKDEYAKDADFRRRFHTESQAVAKLSNTNIVSVYDVNRSDNIEYIVMELVEGVTLKEYMSQNGKLTTSEFLHFAPQIARALEHAHSRGIIHRDIKPQNIIILPDSSLKVTDFGIARFSKSQQTLTDEALGSVHYVSPEQAKGGSIDERSDIYSFGVVMYEMLTGCLPFEGDSPVAVVLQHINSIPLYPREIDPTIPKALEYITMKAMNPNPDKRYSSCEEILMDFENYKMDPSIDLGSAQAENDDILAPLSGDTVKFSKNTVKKSERLHKEPAKDERVLNSNKPQKRQSNHYSDDNDDYYPRRRTPVIAYLIAGILTAAIFFGGAVFIITTIFSSTSGSSQDTQAPPLVGKLLSDVLTNPQYADSYKIVESEKIYNDTFAEGIIISQEPSAGRTIKADTEIYVTVSLGSKKMSLPDLTNSEYRYAQIQLTNLELLYKVEHELSKDIVEGNVIRTEPAALTDVKAGDLITIYVSLGKQRTTTIVPDLKGMKEDVAQRALEKKNLVLGEVIPIEDAEAEAGTIVRQSIEPETEVDEKSTVDIYICDDSIGENNPDVPDNQDGSSQAPKGTYDLTIKLPSSPEKVMVTIKASGDVIYEKEHLTSEGTIIVNLKGTGSILARLYFDDKLSGEQVIVFN